MDLDAIFGTRDHISLAQECARAALVFFFGLALVRLSGRRIFAKWSPLDIIVSIVVGSNLSRTLTGNAPLWGTLLATILLMALHSALSRLAAYFSFISWLVEGRPLVLIEDSHLKRGKLTGHGISEQDVRVALRQAGLEEPSELRLFVLEPNGRFSAIKKS